jgi:membrane protein
VDAPTSRLVRPARYGSPVEWLKQIWSEFQTQHGDLAAAAVALFGLLSLVPAILLAIWLFTTVLARSASSGANEQVWAILKPRLAYFLSGSSATGSPNVLLSTVHEMVLHRTSAGILGAVGLLWAGSRIFNIITEALDEAWRIPKGRSFIRQNLASLAMLLVIGAVFLLSTGCAALVGYSIKFANRLMGHGIAHIAGPAAAILLNVLTSVALFVVVYKWVPNRVVPWAAALFGGVLGGAIWAGFQQLFRLYLEHAATYKGYGTLGAFFILVLWAYYSAYILMLGAVACSVYSERLLGGRGK